MIDIFRSARDSGKAYLLSVVNWGEVYYITFREAGQQGADEVAHLISTLPIHIVAADLELAKHSAIFKSSEKCRTQTASLLHWLSNLTVDR
jgi:hypothetical protein